MVGTDQAAQIASFEQNRTEALGAGRAARGIALLGALTVVSGLGSLVAYNWGKLGPVVKLLAMGLLLAGSAWGTFWAYLTRERHAVRFDVATLIHAGFTLAALALVSQIYDQDGELWQLLLFWCVLTGPVLFATTSRFASAVWYAGLLGTVIAMTDDLAEQIKRLTGLDYDFGDLAAGMVVGTLTAGLALRFMASQYSGRAAVGRTVFWWHLMILGALGGLAFRHGMARGEPVIWLFTLGSFLTLALLMPEHVEELGFGKKGPVLGLCAWALLGLGLPAGLPVDTGIGAFAAFLSFFALAWYLAERASDERNIRFCIFALGMRIVVASFELFENLLITGIVLVGLGALALLWSRKKWAPAAPSGPTLGSGEGGAA